MAAKIGKRQAQYLRFVVDYSAPDQRHTSWVFGSRSERAQIVERLMGRGLIQAHEPVDERDRQSHEITTAGLVALDAFEGEIESEWLDERSHRRKMLETMTMFGKVKAYLEHGSVGLYQEVSVMFPGKPLDRVERWVMAQLIDGGSEALPDLKSYGPSGIDAAVRRLEKRLWVEKDDGVTHGAGARAHACKEVSLTNWFMESVERSKTVKEM